MLPACLRKHSNCWPPNPSNATERIQVPSDFAVVSVDVYDLMGRTTQANIQYTGRNALQMDCSTLPAGQYLVLLRSSKGELGICRLTVQ